MGSATLTPLARNPAAIEQLTDGIGNAYAVLENADGIPEGAERFIEAAVDAVAARLAPTIADLLDAALVDELASRRTRSSE